MKNWLVKKYPKGDILKHISWNHKKKDENVYRFALSAIRGELLERERERDGRERKKR